MTMRATAGLGLVVVGSAATFGLRSWLHGRATGDRGYRGISGRPGSLPWWGGMLFPVAMLLAVAAPLLARTRHLQPLSVLQHPGWGLAGATLMTASLAGVLAAQAAMGLSWRVGVDPSERTTLVTSGVFAHVRNPVFTGMLAALTGLALLVPTVVAAAAVLALAIAVHIQVRYIEEPYLAAIHGRAYTAYAASAGRFLPGIGAGLSTTLRRPQQVPDRTPETDRAVGRAESGHGRTVRRGLQGWRENASGGQPSAALSATTEGAAGCSDACCRRWSSRKGPVCERTWALA